MAALWLDLPHHRSSKLEIELKRILGWLLLLPFCAAWADEPTLPTTFQEQPQQGVLPPSSPSRSKPLKIISADRASRTGQDVLLEGNVEVEYEGYTLKADQIKGNLDTQIFELHGHGLLKGEGDRVEGEDVRVDFKQKIYELVGAKAVVTPARTQGQTSGPFYVSGGKVQMRQPHFHAVDGAMTPCDLDHPHFEFDARDVELEQGKKLVLRHVGLEVFGKRVLGLPYLYIPLVDDRPRYLPEFGQSVDEGYYVKSRFITPLHGADTWETRADYMSKLGLGLGGEYSYDTENLLGSLGAYTLTGQSDTVVANWRHAQRLGSSRLDIDARQQANNYLTAPDTRIFNGRAQLTIPSGAGTSTLGYTRNSSDTGAFGSVSQSVSLSDSRTFGVGTRTNLNATWSDSSSSNSGLVLSQSERIDLRFNAQQEMRSLSADLLYQRSVPVGTTQSFSAASDRTPLLTLRSDTRRLFGAGIGDSWPFRFEGSIGELSNPGGDRITRLTFLTDVNRSDPLGSSRLTLETSGLFSQGLYSDDTAQYQLGYGGALRWQFGGNSSIRLSYRNQKQFGFTPLAIDLAGQNDAFQFGADVDHGKGWRSTLSTGYDVLAIERQQTPWQIVSLGTQYRGRDSSFQLAANYDTFNQNWGIFRADSRFDLWGTGVAASVRYDGSRAVWGAASLQIQGFRFGQLTTDAVLFYNGYTKQMEAQQYALRYDLHCVEAVLEVTDFRSGFRSGRQIAFFIRMKALPFGSDFGFGRRGQRIGGGSGGFGF